jgi:hypothetical protein
VKTKMIKSALLLIVSLYANLLLNEAFSQTANASLDNDCSARSATLSFIGGIPPSGHWEAVPPAGISFVNVNSPSTVALGLPTTGILVRFNWIEDATGLVFDFDEILSYEAQAIPNAGSDITECDPLVTDVQLSANLPPGYTGEWSVLDGQTVPNPFTDPTIPDPFVDLQLGFNRFRWTVTNPTGCSNFDDVEVHFAPVYALAHVAGNLVPICDSTAQLEGNNPSDWDIAPSYFASGNWTHLGAGPTSNVVITDPALYNTTVTGLDPGSNIFEWEITNGFCTSSSTVDIRNDLPTEPNAGNDTIICDDTYILEANLPQPLRGVGAWNPVSGNGVFSDINDPNAQVSDLAYYVSPDQASFIPTNETINVFEWVITYTDPNDGHECALRDTVEIVNLLPSVPADAGLDQTVCGERVNLNALCHGSGAMFHWWEKIGPNLGERFLHPREDIDDNTEFNTRVWHLQSGATTSFQWIKRNELTRYGYTKECFDRDTVAITSVPFPFEPTAGSDRSICEDTCRMQATSAAALGLDPATVTGEWSTLLTYSPGGIGDISYDNINSPSAFVSGLFYGYNILRWTISDLTNNCTYSDDLYIYI